jgi:Multicopper oxidase
MVVVPKVVEVPAGTPLTLNLVNQGQTTHNLTMDSGPKTPDLKPATGGRHRRDLDDRRLLDPRQQGGRMTFEVQQLWSFNGQVPGSALRGKVGDLFTVTLVNDPAKKLGHSIDFHASKVAWNDEMRTIKSGERLVYQFKAKHAGIFMYHSACSRPATSTPPAGAQAPGRRSVGRTA